jgi:hypothetical protein
MIYAFSRALETALAAEGFPYRVTYTPYLDTVRLGGAGIVVARARGANERVGAVIGLKRNPKAVCTRYLAADILVVAKSSKPGAQAHAHEDECDRVVDGVLTAADGLVRGAGATDFQVFDAHMLTAEERGGLGKFVEQWPGAVYVIRLAVPRGVTRLTYQGAGLDEVEIAEVDTTINVSGPGGTGDTFTAAAPGATA